MPNLSDPKTAVPPRVIRAGPPRMPKLYGMKARKVYRVRPRVVLAWLEKDMMGTATRWEVA